MFGTFIAQAQPAVELHDVTAAITTRCASCPILLWATCVLTVPR